ncbi:MAG TPA: nucleotidyl transferase AbiEii/AbiGii toxin family protein [Bacteroidota bacterium]|nr:nucleotidyl transferase AbiEii/AbiGii toxin family protein [Bacteroidota bacterium]
MTKKTFFNKVTNAKEDVLEIFFTMLEELKVKYCVIDGLAVNAYAEPVVSLDLDVVVALEKKDKILNGVKDRFSVEKFEHGINLTSKRSDVRIQIQTDPRYQEFIQRASLKNVLGYEMNVATVEDVLKGKIWAYLDEARRKSKRQKDLADIFRLVEADPRLKENIPEDIRKLM